MPAGPTGAKNSVRSGIAPDRAAAASRRNEDSHSSVSHSGLPM
jgi:hypothetical protein